MSSDRWMTLKEIAAMLGIAEETVLDLGQSRGLPLRRITARKTIGILESELLSWIKLQPQYRPAQNHAK